MDILKELKEFFFEGKLDQLIKEFRTTPTDDMSLAMELKYIPELDARHYEVFDDESERNVEGFIYFESYVSKSLSRLKAEIQKRVNDLIAIRNNSSKFYIQSMKSTGNPFHDIRKVIADTQTYTLYSHHLLLFVTEVEAIFMKLSYTPELPKTEYFTGISKKKRNAGDISFGFSGEKAFLQQLYNFALEKGDFVNKDVTSLADFTQILTSPNVLNEAGKIQFACQTRQACYIIESMRPYFSNWELTSIENSKKFYTKNNQLLSATSISKNNSITTLVNEQVTIDNWFKSQQLKSKK